MSEKIFTLNIPPVEGKNLELPHFPTRMQAFIFRSWDTVSASRMAKVLETSVENVLLLAQNMGLPPQRDDLDIWMEKGYISIIKNNWYLLPYEQLLTLLGWDSAKLAFVLKEDDFLSVKLGNKKPECEKILYRELTEEEEKQTAFIKETVERYILPCHDASEKAPFDFWEKGRQETVSASERISQTAGRVVLSGDWTIVDTIASENTRVFAARFLEDLRLMLGITLRTAERPDGGRSDETADTDVNANVNADTAPKILLRLDNFSNEKAEYHEIDITPAQITVTATDEAGILRGLYYIEDMLRTDRALSCTKVRRRARFGARYIYSYCGLYNDAFDVDSRVYCPDELLETYSRIGINGIWTQAVLYRMVPYPFEPSLSVGWERRQERLLEFAQRAQKYGISVYLYLNEPRSMDLEFFERYPHIKGHVREDGYACLCVSAPEVADYLENSIRMLCEKVPFLGGFFTITRSENLTNCYSHTETPTCPRCSKVPMHEIICKVNGLFAKGAHSVNPAIRVIAWAWGWQAFDDKLDEEKEAIIRHMPKDVILMHTSEEHLSYEVGGIKGTVLDYTMSKIGPGNRAVKAWKLAKETGHETAAKVQLNSTWECSTVPYLPVFGLVRQHLDNLLAQNVDHIMLSWTLGGYPSTNIRIASETFFEAETELPAATAVSDCTPAAASSLTADSCVQADMLDTEYGPCADIVRRATQEFDQAFAEFPFHIGTVYNGPQNGGPANLLFDKPTGLQSTMTGFTFDDLTGWRSIYPEDVFEKQFQKVCDGFERGLQILEAMPKGELWDAALTGYALFKASYNQIRFVRIRDRWLENGDPQDKAALRVIASEELDLAVRIYRTMLHNPTIGYEAANHYYFTRGMLAEKIVNCAHLVEEYS